MLRTINPQCPRIEFLVEGVAYLVDPIDVFNFLVRERASGKEQTIKGIQGELWADLLAVKAKGNGPTLCRRVAGCVPFETALADLVKLRLER
ncbi:hypothetical protein LSTR_LSTR015855 [Laodelphax striatellus]|uniref:Uncharacterized protein n=1 Tax=Laodelphax striatellus TaxID=195883 RepID=A0A482XRK7_LAOST|nr:hypothetical protein LSTR_LSTR015855 [Laodelphax striatellus]